MVFILHQVLGISGEHIVELDKIIVVKIFCSVQDELGVEFVLRLDGPLTNWIHVAEI